MVRGEAHMKLILKRDIFSPEFTMGKLTYNGTQIFTCEDTLRGQGDASTVSEWKRSGITCIPYGTYKVIISFSQRFQKPLPLLLDVPGFSGVRIHSGNTPADTEGCILVGTGRSNGSITNSRLAFTGLFEALEAAGGENVTIEIS